MPWKFITSKSKDLESGVNLACNRVVVKAVKGLLEEQVVDVIVNTTGTDLDLNTSGVSTAILAAAGPKLQLECKQKAPNGIQHGDVFESGGYKLSCKRVYHCALPRWGNPMAYRMLQNMMTHCLEKAYSEKHTSIAFPAPGTGGLGYPANKVAETMLDETLKFAEKYIGSSLVNINFVLFPHDTTTIQGFESVLLELMHGTKPKHIPINTMKDKAIAKQVSSDFDDLLDDMPSRLRSKGFPTPARFKHSDSSSSSSRTLTLGSDTDESPIVTPPDSPVASIALRDKRGYVSSKITPSTPNTTGIAIEVIHGDITKQDTQAIVNAASNKMTDGAQVFKEMLHAGGQTVQDAVAKLRRDGVDGLAVTDAGNMKASYIFHLVVPPKKFLRKIEVDKWETAILTSLSKAHELGLESVSFPALGTGKMNRDPKLMAEILLKSIYSYVKNFPASSLKIIRVVIFQEKLLKIYQEAKIAASKEMQRMIASKGISLTVPEHWTPMAQQQHYSRIELSPSDEFYKRVANNFKRGLKESNRTIIKIERIQNKRLYLTFLVEKNHMEESSVGTKCHRRLWHGTAKSTVEEIMMNNFNRSYSGKNATLYGKGVYFATNSSYSDSKRYTVPDSNGHKYMFQALVLTGNYTSGDSDMKEPPIRHSVKDIRYNSVVDDVENPKLFVIFHDSRVYPEYLITYKIDY